jgi:hypothetical protein
MCSVASGYKRQNLMEREDPWCKMADQGKPGHTIGVLTKGSAVKLTCVCPSHITTCLTFQLFRKQLKAHVFGTAYRDM